MMLPQQSIGESVQIYQLKLVLRGISPQIWRRLLVDADTSLADLLTAFGSHFPLDQRGLEGLGSNRRKLPVEQH